MIKSIVHKDSFLNRKTSEIDARSWRFIIVCLFFLLFTSLLVSRLVQLHIAHTDFLQAQGNARTVRIVDTPSYRGMITDRRGTPIAISTPIHAVWANPKHFEPTAAQLKQLAKLLGIPLQTLTAKIAQHRSKVFVYLKRNVTPDIAQEIQALNIPGLGLKREFRRYYPAAKQAAQLVGFTNIDDKGQAGIELTYDELLKPILGKKRVLEDRTGRWVKDIDQLQIPKSGQDITLSIDLRIQGIAYRELEKAIKQYNAKSATLVMLNVKTGEVLAMVSAPSFNPNNRNEFHGSATRNRTLTDLIEPGSTVKPFSIASALETRTLKPDTIIDTSPGMYYVSNHLVRDLHNNGALSIREVLAKSSNVGISKVTLSLPPEQLLSTFRRMGFGEGIQTNFPGERQGMLPPPPKNPFVHATVAFGYGLTVTPLQIVHAYATLANKGVKLPISLVKVDDPSKLPKEQALPADVSEATFLMLTDVLTKKGSGSRANIPGYKTAGKTGTIRVVGPRGYDPNRHIALFAGVTPVDDPYLATLVIVEEPNEQSYYGGLVAAPIYKNVVGKALHVMNIPPDNTTTATT